jgi:hypothetical protein
LLEVKRSDDTILSAEFFIEADPTEPLLEDSEELTEVITQA